MEGSTQIIAQLIFAQMLELFREQQDDTKSGVKKDTVNRRVFNKPGHQSYRSSCFSASPNPRRRPNPGSSECEEYLQEATKDRAATENNSAIYGEERKIRLGSLINLQFSSKEFKSDSQQDLQRYFEKCIGINKKLFATREAEDKKFIREAEDYKFIREFKDCRREIIDQNIGNYGVVNGGRSINVY